MTDQELHLLLEDMSLQEKIDQLLQLTADFYGKTDRDVVTGPASELGISMEDIDLAGSVLNGTGAKALMQIQDAYMDRHPHHIPLLFMMDVIHGYRTIFPAPIAQGASFDPEMSKRAASVAAREASAAGIHVVFSPMVDLVRDPRWGRVMESTGEDPYLNSRFAAAQIHGFQGDDMKEDGKVCGCIKHFAGYGGAEAGREYNTVQISEHTFREYYLPSYEAGIKAGAGMVMTSFNTVNDIPATINQKLMREILREEMGFDGVLISDYAAILETVAHGASSDKKDAAHKALLAGVDIDMVTGCYAGELATLVKEGTIPESLIDESVLRILQLKNQLGLFEHPHKDADPEKEARYILCPKHRALAREAAAASCVLLKNDKVLPIRPSQKVAFIGPYIDNYEICSSWAVTGHPKDSITVRQAAEELLPASDLTFCHGTSLLPHDYVFAGFAEPNRTEEFYADVFADPAKALADAVATAKTADVVILCLGEHYLQTGEATSRTELSFPENQMELFRAVRAANPNVAVVLFNGRPLLLDELSRDAAAILEAWLPGTEGGHAILDLLTGTKNPSGKLPMTFPRNMGQIPIYYNHFSTGRPLAGTDPQRFVSKYTDAPNTPLFPFGYGLSYAEFSYSDVSLSSDSLTSEDSITASVQLKNTGACTGTEVVQLYIQDVAASTVRPVRELKGFTRITLAPGETQTVSFRISEAELAFHRADGSYGTEPGAFRVWIGGNSATENGTEFTLR
ncbi:MAG: beta-glucosidase BglX [Lachnospiraceae bacterium]